MPDERDRIHALVDRANETFAAYAVVIHKLSSEALYVANGEPTPADKVREVDRIAEYLDGGLIEDIADELRALAEPRQLDALARLPRPDARNPVPWSVTEPIPCGIFFGYPRATVRTSLDTLDYDRWQVVVRTPQDRVEPERIHAQARSRTLRLALSRALHVPSYKPDEQALLLDLEERILQIALALPEGDSPA